MNLGESVLSMLRVGLRDSKYCADILLIINYCTTLQEYIF